MMIELSQRNFGLLAICATRYCQGRQSYMPDLIRNIVGCHIKGISDSDLHIMLEDCGFQERMNLYGDEYIDKPGWLVWKQVLENELERRKRNDNTIMDNRNH